MGKFEHKKDGTIVINSVRIPLGLFLRLEPSYSVPNDSVSQVYVQGEGRLVVGKTTYKIKGEWSDGDRYISREHEFASALSTETAEWREARELVASIESDRKPSTDKRKAEYPSVQELVVALWKHVVEGKDLKDSGATDLQAMREAVKSKYPEETKCQPSTQDKNSSTTASARSARPSSKSTSMKSKSKTASMTRSDSSASTHSTESNEST
jgi:hypothetical protein